LSVVPKILSRNWQLKASALAMAVLLWTVPRFDAQDSRVLEDVPVRVQLNDPMWTLVDEASPPTVTVTLSGPARELLGIGMDRPPVLIPMDEVLAGDTTVFLRPSWFRGSSRDGVVVEDVSPDVVRLTFEALDQRSLPFSISLFGSLPQGLSLAGPPEITPEVTAVFGPASRIAGMDSIGLQPLDLSTVDSSGPITLPVDSSVLQGLNVLPYEASVVIPTEATATREFPDIPVSVPRLAADPQLQSRPASVTVVLFGARTLVEGIDPADLRVAIPANRAMLAPGEEDTVVLAVEGIPPFVGFRVSPDWVTLRRPAGS